MCGIAGLFLAESSDSGIDVKLKLERMATAQAHRGPDDEGMYVMPDLRGGLANRRLAIRDLSPAGHMPMKNGEGSVWLTYNGEIYNAGALRAELRHLGCSFVSDSDSEVILQGYIVWGERVVDRLQGIFAFAVLDTRGRIDNGKLFLARDRLGVKPLYYGRTSDGFVFASELKAMLASGTVGREISSGALVGYLMMGSVPMPLTIYRDILSLDAGCTLTVNLDAMEAVPEPRPYWSVPTVSENTASPEEMVEGIRHLLSAAVRSELVSDVPLGAFLSGGLDSSVIVALVRRATDGPIRTCSMIFEEAPYDERHYARVMAEAAGAEHVEHVITAFDLDRELDHIFWAMDQPTVDGVNTYFVSKTAREAGLTVSLSGLGADELFGGYANTFQGVPSLTRGLRVASKVPAGAALASSMIKAMPQRHRWAKLDGALRRDPSPMSAYLARRGLFSPAEVQELVTSDVWNEALTEFDPIAYIGAHVDGREPIKSFNRNPFSWTSRAELNTYMRSQLLRDTDVMSMAHSLEVRVPFLDHHLVEAIVRLPSSVLQDSGASKGLLRRVAFDWLPPEIRDRRGKQGFTLPFDVWMRRPLRRRFEERLESVSEMPCVQRETVCRVWDRYEENKVHWSRAWGLGALFMLT